MLNERKKSPSLEYTESLEEDEERKIHSLVMENRKLYLALDLDQSLIHTRDIKLLQFQRLKEKYCFKGVKRHNIEIFWKQEINGFTYYIYELKYGKDFCSYYLTCIRSYLNEFFHRIRNKYYLSIFTAGKPHYAKKIQLIIQDFVDDDVIDLFAGNIHASDELNKRDVGFGDTPYKTLKQVFGKNKPYSLCMDDNLIAWKKDNRRCLVLRKFEMDNIVNVEPNQVIKSINNMHPRQLERCSEILEQIHQQFFNQYKGEMDVEEILMNIRKKAYKNIHLTYDPQYTNSYLANDLRKYNNDFYLNIRPYVNEKTTHYFSSKLEPIPQSIIEQDFLDSMFKIDYSWLIDVVSLIEVNTSVNQASYYFDDYFEDIEAENGDDVDKQPDGFEDEDIDFDFDTDSEDEMNEKVHYQSRMKNTFQTTVDEINFELGKELMYEEDWLHNTDRHHRVMLSDDMVSKLLKPSSSQVEELFRLSCVSTRFRRIALEVLNEEINRSAERILLHKWSSLKLFGPFVKKARKLQIFDVQEPTQENIDQLRIFENLEKLYVFRPLQLLNFHNLPKNCQIIGVLDDNINANVRGIEKAIDRSNLLKIEKKHPFVHRSSFESHFDLVMKMVLNKEKYPNLDSILETFDTGFFYCLNRKGESDKNIQLIQRLGLSEVVNMIKRLAFYIENPVGKAKVEYEKVIINFLKKKLLNNEDQLEMYVGPITTRINEVLQQFLSLHTIVLVDLNSRIDHFLSEEPIMERISIESLWPVNVETLKYLTDFIKNLNGFTTHLSIFRRYPLIEHDYMFTRSKFVRSELMKSLKESQQSLKHLTLFVDLTIDDLYELVSHFRKLEIVGCLRLVEDHKLNCNNEDDIRLDVSRFPNFQQIQGLKFGTQEDLSNFEENSLKYLKLFPNLNQIEYCCDVNFLSLEVLPKTLTKLILDINSIDDLFVSNKIIVARFKMFVLKCPFLEKVIFRLNQPQKGSKNYRSSIDSENLLRYKRYSNDLDKLQKNIHKKNNLLSILQETFKQIFFEVDQA
eukprot:TRINITY_DN183_c0_g1_i1.p1 TRINITY_DN183_c0_g1~~TRINITY_DN183_c0_g1_i1.p1  ORF type:complete len:1021 (+),score=244.83 TRINITY_DN183_c0_g1_i1:32-3094(+)